MFAIDANVVVRYLTQDHQELAAKADVIIEGVEDGRLSVFCDPITLGEVVFYLLHAIGLAGLRSLMLWSLS